MKNCVILYSMHRLIFLTLFCSFFVVSSYAGSDSLFLYYKKLNSQEKRLAEYSDNDEALRVKLKQLDLINASRKKHNAKPLELDILASRVANKMCREAVENNYLGHWNMAGEKPYQRYAFAGGKDHITENAASRSVKGNPHDLSSKGILQNMEHLHNLFMQEKAPADAHKQNVIDKMHNYVGIGYYSTKNEFRYYEEFIDRYLSFSEIPASIKPGEKIKITITPPEGQFLYFLTAYQEEFPKPMKPKDIERRNSYPDYGDKEALSYAPWELSSMKSGASYSIPLSFKKPGLYYIHIYLDNKAPGNKRNYNTKGKTPVSGIVLRVEDVR